MSIKGQVLQRYYGWYANRTRGIRRRGGVHEQPPTAEPESVPPSLPEARRRWAELLRRIFEVDPLRCPRCGYMALIHTGLGQGQGQGQGHEDQAIEYLQQAFDERCWNLVYLNVEPAYAFLRSDPRFCSLVDALRLPKCE